MKFAIESDVNESPKKKKKTTPKKSPKKKQKKTTHPWQKCHKWQVT